MMTIGLNALGMLLTLSTTVSADAVREVRRWSFDDPAELQGWRVGNGITDLRVADGSLAGRLTDPDAYLFAPPVDVPLDGLEVRVRWRCDRAGLCQVYWGTDAQPALTEQRQMARPAVDADTWIEHAFPVGRPEDHNGRLTTFRLDPFNGNRDGSFEIDRVALVRTAPVIDVSLAADRAVIRPGETVRAHVDARQTAGRHAAGRLEATLIMDGKTRKDAAVQVSAGKGADPTLVPIELDAKGVHALHATIASRDGGPGFDLDGTVVVHSGDAPIEDYTISMEGLGLEVLPIVGGADIGAAQLWSSDAHGVTRRVGLLSPLVELAWLTDEGRVVSIHPRFWIAGRSHDQVKLSARRMVGNDAWQVTLTLRLSKSAVQVHAALRGPVGGRLLRFVGPALLTGLDATDSLDRYALFGGLEYLEPGWKSSSPRAVGEKFAERWAPHPFKVTLPVMAVEQDGVTVGLLWDPNQRWDGEHTLPTATFASPNFLHGQPGHLMQLSLPSIDAWVDENASRSARPYRLADEQPLQLAYTIRVARNESVTWMAKHWYATYGAPSPPAAPHDDKTTYDMMARNYGETTYWENEKGWRRHWFLEKSSGFAGDVAAELVAHATSTGNTKWVEKTGVAGREIIDLLGPLSRRLKDAGSADAAVGAMRPDGTWAFHNTPTMIERTRHHSQGRYETLGEEGSTSLGTCVQQALPILHHAALTGRPDYVGASKKALDAMQRFRVPRGAQVWEVAQGVPDIRASALAVQAYHLGYEITGERRYLDEAVYWAYTGLPFLYSWHVPHNHRPAEVNTSPDRNHPQHTRIPVAELFIEPVREITPYACIPVLGTTFYVHSWFGNVVQWCGLEWAWHVIDLTRVVEDKLLRDVADGVVRSGLQQTFDREPWVGLYPDSWDLVTNTGAGALLSARLTLACLKAQGAVPNWASTWSRGVDLHGKRLLVNGFGTSTRCEVVDGDLVVSVDFTPGSRNELVVAHTSRPRSVTVKGKKAPHGDGIPGWRAVEESDVIVVSFVQGRSKPCTITLRW